MYYMTFPVNHDVSIVPILNLQDIARNGIRSHGLYEVHTRFLERDRVLTAILGNEKVEQVINFRTTHLIPRCRIRHDVNNTTLRRRSANWEFNLGERNG